MIILAWILFWIYLVSTIVLLILGNEFCFWYFIPILNTFLFTIILISTILFIKENL